MGSQNPYRNPDCPPDFRIGDFVTPKRGKNCYGRDFRHGVFREVVGVIFDEYNGAHPGTWVLVINNPHKAGMNPPYSKYNPDNFTKEAHLINHICPLGTTETSHNQHTTGEARYFGFRISTGDLSEEVIKLVTGAHKRQTDCEAEIFNMISGEEDAFVIMKSVKRIQALPPKPPIRITELR